MGNARMFLLSTCDIGTEKEEGSWRLMKILRSLAMRAKATHTHTHTQRHTPHTRTKLKVLVVWPGLVYSVASST